MEKNRFAQIEEKILEFWEKNQIFSKSIEQRPADKPYVFYDGPPFATGLPHYGHILASVTKDLFPRYFTMKGYRVRRRWGWDCHGLPIETLVEKELNISGKKQIEEKGVDIFNRTARSMVLSYADQWKKMIERIGRWVEFDNSYKTMDTTYMESVWWALKKIWDEGLIYEGRKVLLYCPRCETPVSNAEITMDNSYKDVTEESLTIKFKLKPGQEFGESYKTGDSAYILAWTTTPWTLPGNVALAVGPEIAYAALRIKGTAELYILASALVKTVFEDKEIEIVHENIMGKELVNLEYEPLFEVEAAQKSGKKAWYVASVDFVTTEEGTGVVHTAVVYGEDDYNLGLKIDLPVISMLDSAGYYNEDAPEFLRGKFYKAAEKEIKQNLDERGLVFEKKSYTHSYPFCWRCDSALIYNAISAWFINIQAKKDQLIKLNEKINWYPEYLKHGRFLNILESAPDWNISRNRYWATALPFFRCTDCKETQCIGSIDELREKSTNFDSVYGGKSIKEIDLHRPYIDSIEVRCDKCDGVAKRIPEVIDCWVESGSMPFAEWHYPFENKEEFESRYPGQFIGEYISQTRAWFYYMHAVGTFVFDSISFENVVSTGVILNDKGEKMSKSKQNYPDPWLMLDAYGADTLRFYIMNSTVMQAENLLFNERELREIYNKIINTIYNVSNYYKIYESEFTNDKFNKGKLTVLDKFIISKLQSLISNTTEALDNYNTVSATREIKGFVDELSTWWLRRSRERFKEGGEDGQTAFSILRYILQNLMKVMAPVTPFLTEEIYRMVKQDDEPESVHLCAWPTQDNELKFDEIVKEMDVLRKIVEMGHSLRAQNGLRLRQPIGAVTFNQSFSSSEFDQMILDELNVEKIVKEDEILEPETTEEGNIKVTIDKKLDERLISLGDVRELTRGIQEKRKKMGFKQGELVRAVYRAENPESKEFIKSTKQRLMRASSLSSLEEASDIGEGGFEIIISKGKISINIESSKN